MKFFTPWCGHCKKMATAYIELAKQLAGKADLDIAEVDCTEQKQLCADQQVCFVNVIASFLCNLVVTTRTRRLSGQLPLTSVSEWCASVVNLQYTPVKCALSWYWCCNLFV